MRVAHNSRTNELWVMDDQAIVFGDGKFITTYARCDTTGFHFIGSPWWDAAAYGCSASATAATNATAITAAIAAASAAGGGTVFLPFGTITTTRITLASGVTLRGAGIGVTTLKLADSTNLALIRGVSLTDVAVENMTIDGNKANNSGSFDSVNFNLCTRARVQNLYITNSAKCGVAFSGSAYSSASFVTTSGTAQCGIYVGLSSTTHSTGTTVTECKVLTPGLDGIVVDCDDVTVSNCYVNGSVYSAGTGYSGIYVGLNRNRVITTGNTCVATSNFGIDYDAGNAATTYGAVCVGNTCYGNRNAGIAMGSNGGTVTGNTCYNNGQTIGAAPDNPYGIRVGADDVIVDGNICHDTQGGPTQTYGVYLADGTSRANVKSNNLRGNVTAPVRIGTAAAYQIRGNTGWVTEAKGTSAVTNGTTSIAVTHGLAVTPATSDITVTLTNNPTNNVRHWVSAVASTTFTVTTSGDPGAATLAFAWQAQVL